MTATRGLNIFALTLVVFALGSIAAKNIHGSAPVQLLNASYDPTRELYAALNRHFADAYAKTHHTTLAIEQSHGGSWRQARAVIDAKLAADVVTFGLISDVGALQKRGHVEAGWALVLVLAPLTRYIPKAALAGLLIVAAARLIDIPRIRYVSRAGIYDAFLLFGTLATTLAVCVEYSILIGVVVSVLLFVPRAARLRVRQLVVTEERIVRERVITDAPPSAVQIYDFEGELFFGAAPEFEARLQEALVDAKAYGITHVVCRVKHLRNPDAVSLERLEHFLRDAQKQGFTVFLAGIRPDLRRGMERLHFADFFPVERWFFEQERERDSATLKAVRHAYQLLGIQRPTDTVAYYLV